MLTVTQNPKSRDELKSYFTNNRQLSQTHFAELINSTLNKRDDHFHGTWQEGRTYRKGDIVYYDGALWEMIAEQETCAHAGETPDKNQNWASRLIKLEQRVTSLEKEVGSLKDSFQQLQQDFINFKKQISRFLSILILGFGFFLLWLLVDSIFHSLRHFLHAAP